MASLGIPEISPEFEAQLSEGLSRVETRLRELRSHKALEESRAQLVSIAKEARAALGPLPVGEATGALLSLCDAVIDRTA